MMALTFRRFHRGAWLALCWVLLATQPLAAKAGDRIEATAVSLRDRALGDDTAFDIVTSLTTEVGARPAGSPADARAVAWAVAKFKTLGYDKVYKEAVTFPVWRRVSESAAVTFPAQHRLAITALGGSVGSNGTLQAHVVPLRNTDDLQRTTAESVKGKIVLLTQRMERRTDGSGYLDVLSMRTNAASIAARKGALAVLIRSLGTDNNRLPHTGSVVYDDGAAIPAAALSGPDTDLLERLLTIHRAVEIKLDIAVDTSATYTSHNVIGEITGRGEHPGIVMLGAHLDSWDLGTGAVDDGFGVAVTMAAGALMKTLHAEPSHTVRVVLFANEENGFHGAKHYAARNITDLRNHRIAVESDWGAGRIYALRHFSPTPALAGAMRRVLGPLGVALDGHAGSPGPDVGVIAKQNVPWSQLAQDASSLFDHHHSDNDTLDKIDPAALKQNVAAYAAFAWLMAN